MLTDTEGAQWENAASPCRDDGQRRGSTDREKSPYSFVTGDRTEPRTVPTDHDTVQMKYNQYGLLDYVNGVLTGDADKVSYVYDSDYRLETLKYYIYNTGTSQYDQVEVDYDYDTFGRLETITDRLSEVSTYAYNDDSTIESLTLPNGTVTDYTYDDLQRLVTIATSGLSAGDVIAKFTYHYNNLGLRDKVTMGDGRTIEWDYDDVGRLVEEHFKSGGPSPATLLRYVYTYDGAGNRATKKTDYDDNDGNGYAATATYTNNAYNQLTAVAGTPARGTKVNVTGTIPTAWTFAGGDVQVTPNGGSAVDAEIRGRFFIARMVPLEDGTNAIEASATGATTPAGHSVTADSVSGIELDTAMDEEYTYDDNGNLTQKTEDVNGTTVQWDYTYSVEGWLVKVEKAECSSSASLGQRGGSC